MIIKSLKNYIKQHPSIYHFINKCFPVRGSGNKIITGKGAYMNAKVYIKGNNNIIKFGENSHISSIPIYVRGNNNYIEIGENVKIIQSRWNILCEGNRCKIIIGKNTSIQSAHINAQEDESVIHIGEDCLLSEDIIIRTSDSHPIYDIKSGERINPAASIHIGNHVWISARALILKGVTIGNHSIIGVGSIVTHDIPSESIAAGLPAKVKREHITWNKTF